MRILNTHTHTHTCIHVQIFIGDRLLSVGNTNVENLSIAGVRALIVGPPGSVLQLRLLRGGEVRTVRLARGAAGEFSGKHLQQLHLQQHMSQMASPQPRRQLLNMPNSNSSSNASDAPSTPTAPSAPPLVTAAFNTPQPLPGHAAFPSPMREYICAYAFIYVRWFSLIHRAPSLVMPNFVHTYTRTFIYACTHT
jgi:hypothetical protein